MEYLNALGNNYRIQEYEFVRVLGAGGFGITYLAYDHNLDKPVAIKEYLPNDLAVRIDGTTVKPKATHDKENYEWGLDSFLKEARALARFDHRNLIKVYRFFEAHGTAYIVMEYAEGETLSKLLERQGTLSEAQLKGILLPILDGLEKVHQADYLHRDIKPGNIVIRDEDQSPVLIDFGAARQAVGIKSKSVTSIVTPGYAPIEQYSTKGKQGPWTDIYALGAVSYRAITGIEADDATERIVNDELPRAVEAGKGKASAALLVGIDAALKVKLDERPQSIKQWRKMLGGDEVAPSRPVTATPKVSSTSATGKTTPALGMSVILLAVAGGAGYYLSQQDRSSLLPAAPVEEISPTVKAPAHTALISTEARSEEDELRRQPQGHALVGEMIRIQGGTFQMGSNNADDDAERPVHQVRIKSFWLGKTEVTQEQWQAVMGNNPSHFKGCDNCPVEDVSWDDVESFIHTLNRKTGGRYRLPSESEWEYACRSGGKDEKYCGGSNADGLAWYESNSRDRSHPVAQKQPNSLGLYDMSGNVWEWVEDCWHDNYDGAPMDGSAWTQGDCNGRVFRGGSWDFFPSGLRSSYRFWFVRSYSFNYDRGFRLAMD